MRISFLITGLVIPALFLAGCATSTEKPAPTASEATSSTVDHPHTGAEAPDHHNGQTESASHDDAGQPPHRD